MTEADNITPPAERAFSRGFMQGIDGALTPPPAGSEFDTPACWFQWAYGVYLGGEPWIETPQGVRHKHALYLALGEGGAVREIVRLFGGKVGGEA